MVLPKAAHLEHMGITKEKNCCYEESQVFDLDLMKTVADVITANDFYKEVGCKVISLPAWSSDSYVHHYSGGVFGSTAALRKELQLSSCDGSLLHSSTREV